MDKNCIFLSDRNYVMLYDIRKISLSKGVELYPCLNVFEMLKKYYEGTNAIIIEKVDKFKNIEQYLSQELYGILYYTDGKGIYNLNNEILFDNIEDFFNSNIFYKKLVKQNLGQILSQIDTKFEQLGIVANDWHIIFIKALLYEIKKRELPITRDTVDLVLMINSSQRKYLYDTLRPTLKEISKAMQEHLIVEKASCKVLEILSALHKCCFE